MLDVFGIFTASIAVLFVLVRAAMLDRSFPWFEDLGPDENQQAGGKPTRAPIGKPNPHRF